MPPKRHTPDWQNITDEELLRYRIRDMGLQIPGTVLESRVARLYTELQEKGITFHPACYLADEWLCPDREPIIGIPFYLAQPRLVAIEKRMMLEAEGSTEEWCMKLLRHECGHALNYAYCFFTDRNWRKLFGPFEAPYYHVTYRTKPYSKRYVLHLEDNYAQAHPDEDFAETFAVWLDPAHDWRVRYRGWPALKKLEYVDSLMREAAGRPPLVTTTSQSWAAARMTSTLSAFYDRKRKYLGAEFPGYYDPGLQRIFRVPAENEPADKASNRAEYFLRKHRKALLQCIALWVPQRKYDVDRLLEKLMARCLHLDLRLRKSPEETLLAVNSFVTAILASLQRFNGVHEGK
ncbi:MAG TPA: hypothetical protein DCQ83_00505 [Fibrobacteres bacterium]|jgi:hypothetical protein|nr:hypothetical protein [Fibrobacterota bacterium]